MMYHSCVCIEMQIHFTLTRFYGGSFLRRLLSSAFEYGGRLWSRRRSKFWSSTKQWQQRWWPKYELGSTCSIFDKEMDGHHMGLVEIAVSTSADQALKEMMEALDKENSPLAPSQTTGQNPKRLKKKVTEQELLLLQENKQSVATKRNTSWSMKVFQG